MTANNVQKASRIILPAILLALLAAQFSACEKYVLPELSISSDTLRFSAAADSQAVVVSTNVITTVYPESQDSWVSATPEWFNASCTITVKVSENTAPEKRTATLPVKSEALKRDLVVIQEGQEKQEKLSPDFDHAAMVADHGAQPAFTEPGM